MYLGRMVFGAEGWYSWVILGEEGTGTFQVKEREHYLVFVLQGRRTFLSCNFGYGGFFLNPQGVITNSTFRILHFPIRVAKEMLLDG